jgi:hypothetical protein
MAQNSSSKKENKDDLNYSTTIKRKPDSSEEKTPD